MSETKSSGEVFVLSTSSSPTTVLEWNSFRSALVRAAPVITGIGGPNERADAVLATGGRASAGTAPSVIETLSFSDTLSPNVIQFAPTENPGATERAYPHLVEAAQPVVALVRRCLHDARLALESFEDSDFAGVAMRLSAIAAQCATAHPMTTFNEGFGAVVSFVRRAAISVDVAAISRPTLNAMIRALNSLSNDPMISVGEAADILSELSDSGWTGEYAAVERLLEALLAEAVESEGSHLPHEQQQV